MARRRFMVFNGSPQKYEVLQRAGIKDFQAGILAVWEVPFNGPDWLDQLVEQGDANWLFRHGRHTRCVSHAFFVQRLDLWKDIRVHWERRQAAIAAAVAAVAAVSEIAPAGSKNYVPQHSAWVTVSFLRPKDLQECPPEAIWTLDALDLIA